MQLWTAVNHDARPRIDTPPPALLERRPFGDCLAVARMFLQRRAVEVFGTSTGCQVTETDEGNGLWSVTLRGPRGSVIGLIGITSAGEC